MVFPVILIVTFLIVFFALYIAQGAIVYYETSTAAERAAFTWSNSAKDPRTGAYPSGQYEGLYWRLAEDQLLAGLFGKQAKADSVSIIQAGETKSSGGGGLTERKLLAAAGSLNASRSGEWSYRNSVLIRKVTGEASSEAVPEPLRRAWPAAAIQTEATAVVVEPAEFIRSVDLIRYYTLKLRGAEEGEDAYRKKAQAILQTRVPT